MARPRGTTSPRPQRVVTREEEETACERLQELKYLWESDLIPSKELYSGLQRRHLPRNLGPPNRHSSRSLLQLDHRGKTHVVRPLRRVSTRSGRVSGAPVAPRVVKNTLRG